MARTSRRRNQKDEKNLNTENYTKITKAPAAAYVRLSVEETKGDTIDTQLETLKDYISNCAGIYLEDVYIDNGYTGTNFDRPEFNRMMTDVRSGRIKCIVVKDLSRFGRNFLESGYYIETLLPKLNVRLIAITDDFDSSRQSDQDALSVPIKNMVNDFYAKDYSKKISDMNAARRRSGKYTIERSVYGYSVDKEKDEYYINPETAPIVQSIFRWYLAGLRPGLIAKRLNLLGIITPKEYKSLYETGEEMTASTIWTAGKVITVLRRDAYVGDRCLGTRLTSLYKNYSDKEIPRDEWTIYKDDHDPLITREDFAEVTKRMNKHVEERRAVIKRGHELNPDLDNVFSHIAFCGRCGRKLRIETKRYRNGIIKMEGAAYVCKGRVGKNSKDGCYLRIEMDLLKIIVADQIRMMVDLMLDQQKIITDLRKSQTEKNPIQKYKMRISTLVMKEDQCSEKLARVYEDLAAGVIEKDDYTTLREKYQRERQQYGEKITEYRYLIKRAQESMKAFDSIVEELKKNFYPVQLKRELLDYLVERIIVHDDHHVEIKYRFEDVFSTVSSIVEGGDSE